MKHNEFGCELKLQSYSVIIECIDYSVQSIKSSFIHFNNLLENNPNTFCGKYYNYYYNLLKYNKKIIIIVFLDLFGVCINISDVEVCCNSVTQTEIAKREIILIDTSMATVSIVYIIFYNFK